MTKHKATIGPEPLQMFPAASKFDPRSDAPISEHPRTSPQYDRYIALGDSISISYYPARDLEQRGVTVARPSGVGAASLFFRNDDELWPEYRGRDLTTASPNATFRDAHDGSHPDDPQGDNLTADAATTTELVEGVAELLASEEQTVVTITIGGNDLLQAAGVRGQSLSAAIADPSAAVAANVERALDSLFRLRPNTHLLLGTVYDPTDGTNLLPAHGEWVDFSSESIWLVHYNDRLRELAKSDSRITLVDIHGHFLGHGIAAPEAERWYWRDLIIEPNARGASEVRRLWLEAVGI